MFSFLVEDTAPVVEAYMAKSRAKSEYKADECTDLTLLLLSPRTYYMYIFYILCVKGLRYEISAYKTKTLPSRNNFTPPTLDPNIPQLIFRVLGRSY